jgi:dTDP-glucose 4,6-dehydratase
MTKILVTGGAGFIGSCFVHQRVAAGDTLLVLDALTYAGHKENLAEVLSKIELVVGSITDGALVASLYEKFQPDLVINFAAESHVDNSIASPSAFIDTNIIGTYTMIEAARQWKKRPSHFRFVQVSTDEVYGELGTSGKFYEGYPYQPNSPYSASKAAGDLLARAWFHTYQFPIITTNCSNNYGPRQYPEKLIPLMITNALSGKPLPVYGDGKNIRDWIHVEDHCSGVFLAATNGTPGETYVFGGHSERKNLDVVQEICRILDRVKPRTDKHSYAPQITFVKDRPGHDQRYAIDDSKAKYKLGYTRKYQNFEEGLEATIKWYLANTAWAQAVTQKKAA